MKWMGTDMRKLAAVLCVVGAWLVLGGSAWAAVEVEWIETWHAGDAVTIGTNQNYYLRIAYRADEPVHIWARPWFQGREVAAGSNPSPRYDAGSGEALGWFFLDPGQQVDERTEEHTSELQSLLRISYAVLCLTKNNNYTCL